jgi:hypothetical protein
MQEAVLSTFPHMEPLSSLGCAVRFRFEANKRNGSEIPFVSKRSRGVSFACFALKRNSRFYMRNEKKIKRNKAKKAIRKRNESAKQKKRRENKREKNILKLNEGENSLYLFSL